MILYFEHELSNCLGLFFISNDILSRILSNRLTYSYEKIWILGVIDHGGQSSVIWRGPKREGDKPVRWPEWLLVVPREHALKPT